MRGATGEAAAGFRGRVRSPCRVRGARRGWPEHRAARPGNLGPAGCQGRGARPGPHCAQGGGGLFLAAAVAL